MNAVYIPIVDLPRGIGGPALIRDAAGSLVPVRAGLVDVVDAKLCVIALHLAEYDGRHLVRFADKTECLVNRCPEWQYEPFVEITHCSAA